MWIGGGDGAVGGRNLEDTAEIFSISVLGQMRIQPTLLLSVCLSAMFKKTQTLCFKES